METTDGDAVGELERVEHGAAQDLLVIRTPEREVLFPFVSALVPEVDVAGGRIVIDDRPGTAGRAVTMRIDVVSIFPDYLAPLGPLAARARPGRAACSTCTSTTCATGPTTATAPSTTPPTAAAPAW